MIKNTLEYLMGLIPLTESLFYREARTIAMEFAVQNIEIKDGVACEFGVMNGESARHLISLLPKDVEIYLFDSIEGLPVDWCGHLKKGRYAVSEIPVFTESNVGVVKGWFADTLPDFNLNKPIAFIHIDCDIYSSTKTVFENIDIYIKPGTIILFDEYFNYEYFLDHEFKAFTEWAVENEREFEYIGRTLIGQAIVRILK